MEEPRLEVEKILKLLNTRKRAKIANFEDAKHRAEVLAQVGNSEVFQDFLDKFGIEDIRKALVILNLGIYLGISYPKDEVKVPTAAKVAA